MVNVKSLIGEYLKSKELAWAPSTLRSETHRMTKLEKLLDKDPVTVWRSLQYLKPYTRTTTWTRICGFIDWCIRKGHMKGPNPFEGFREENARLFKNVYEKKPAKTTYQEAINAIRSIGAEDVRSRCFELLSGGLRAHEQVQFDGTVIGKGGKSRAAFTKGSGRGQHPSYHRVYRALKKAGLKPHELRKVFATSLVEAGANPFELCEAMGWSHINTAQSYVRANQQSLADKVKEVQALGQQVSECIRKGDESSSVA